MISVSRGLNPKLMAHKLTTMLENPFVFLSNLKKKLNLHWIKAV